MILFGLRIVVAEKERKDKITRYSTSGFWVKLSMSQNIVNTFGSMRE